MNSSGFFGIGVFHPKHSENIGTLMRSAIAFGASFVYTIGRRYVRQASDTSNAATQVPLYHFLTVEDLVEHLPHACPLIGVELADNARPLNQFSHPRIACYMLGAEDHGLPPKVASRCHQLVVIPGAAQCLNVATAGSIVIYDRLSKQR